MTGDNLEPAPRKNVGKQSEQIARNEREQIKVWNAAIEAAANVVDKCNREGPYNAIIAAPIIRKLKK